MNESVRRQGRREIQPHAKFLEQNGNSSKSPGRRALQHRERKLSAGEEARFFARFRQKIWLSENLQEVLFLERFNYCSQVDARIEQEQVQNVANFLLVGKYLIANRRTLDPKDVRNVGRSHASKLTGREVADGLAGSGGK